jgi:competence protein ComGC
MIKFSIFIIIIFPILSFANIAINIDGKIDFQAGITSQKSIYKIDHNTESTLKSDAASNFNINAQCKNDHGTIYGGLIQISSDNIHDKINNNQYMGDGAFIKRSFIYFNNIYGKLELGAQESVTLQMEAGPNRFSSGSGGINGNWASYVNTSIGTIKDSQNNTMPANYITSAHLPFDSGSFDAGDDKHATKLNYFSPQILGLQIGYSFTPQTNQNGTNKGFNNPYKNALSAAKNVSNLSLTYRNQIYNYDIEANMALILGKAVEIRNPSPSKEVTYLKAYSTSITVTKDNYKFGGSYSNWGKSLNYRHETGSTEQKGSFYTIGANYNYLKQYIVSAAMLNSKWQGNKTKVMSMGLDYILSKEFIPFIETTFFMITPARDVFIDTESNSAPPQTGKVILIGTKFYF